MSDEYIYKQYFFAVKFDFIDIRVQALENNVFFCQLNLSNYLLFSVEKIIEAKKRTGFYVLWLHSTVFPVLQNPDYFPYITNKFLKQPLRRIA